MKIIFYILKFCLEPEVVTFDADGGVLGASDVLMSGNIVVDATSVADDEKLLHFVMIQSRNSLCKWT